MVKVKEGLVDPELLEKHPEFYREDNGSVREIRKTDDPWRKDLYAGNVNSVSDHVGTLEIPEDVKSWYATAHFNEGVGLYAVSMVLWGEFIAEYMNIITKEKE